MRSALGIEAVEWFARGDENLTVRVTGRWRRRRPALGGQPLLVIEAAGQRHRFPATPEPPGLTGAAPGTRQLSFTVPAALASPALERAWLQMGAVVMPLPVAVEAQKPGAATESDAGVRHDGEAADPQLLAERRLRSSELALQAARMRATQAEQSAAELAARAAELERELDGLRVEPARLQALLRERDSARRAADQRAHAERAMRIELQEELAERRREEDDADSVLDELELARARMANLEAEIEQLRRRADEADQIAAAASAARDEAQGALARRGAETRESGLRMPDLALRIAAEARLVPGLVALTVAPALLRPHRWPPSKALAAERRLIIVHGRSGATAHVDDAMPATLRRELASRASAGAQLRSLLARPVEHAAGSPHDRSLTATHLALRAEFVELRALSEAERARRHAAERRALELERQVDDYAARCAGAYEAIEQLRPRLEDLRRAIAFASSGTASAVPHRETERTDTPGVPVQAVAGRGRLDPGRLDAALFRLRESAAAHEAQAATPPPEPVAADSPRPWLARVFSLLAERDPGAAARLLLALLPAQGLVCARPLAYDLVLQGLGCVQVTVENPEHTATVRLTDTPRSMSAVQFAIAGDPARLAALVASGSLGRRFRRRRVRISGERAVAAALLDLVHTPLRLGQLLAAGFTVDPWLALTMVSLMIDPAWTRGERFSVALQEPESVAPGPQLQIRDGRRPCVSETKLSLPPATRIDCAGDRLLPALAGEPSGVVRVCGEARPMALLQQWIERAQSG